MNPAANEPESENKASSPVPVPGPPPARTPTAGIPAPVQIQASLSAIPSENPSKSAPIVIPPAPVASSLQPQVVEIQRETGPRFHPPITAAPPRKNMLVEYWRKAGGGSFMVSLGIHMALLIAGYFVVETIVHEQKVDFLPGGGGKQGQEASQAVSQQVQAKKRNSMQESRPMQRIISTSNTATISLKDTPLEAIEVPTMSSMLGGGSMSSGFGNGGSGGGFGKGTGLGGMDSIAFKPIFMFGQRLKARSIGVVLDVSGSMTPHLTKVIKELDRVAKGSPVVLYVGCGIVTPAKGVRLDDKTIPTINKSKDEAKSFELFWRRSHTRKPDPNAAPAPKKKNKDDKDPIPEEEVYTVMATRPETYFIKSQGIQYSWVSLMADEFRHVDAVYWFSDFQDAVDDEQIEKLFKHFSRREQKLYIHASQKGKSFATVRDKLVLPTGGQVIEADTKS
jgi:hypothetical protein